MIFQKGIGNPAKFVAMRAHFLRVITDGGTVKNIDFTQQYYEMCSDNDMFDSIQFAWLGDVGSKFRTSGIYSYFTKIYSLLGGNDATQTTSTNQPYLSGNIAPNERYGLKNPKGGSSVMTHTPISFVAGDSWSVTDMLNWNASNTTDQYLIRSETTSLINLDNASNRFKVYVYTPSASAIFTFDGKKLIGKNTIITLTKSSNILYLYINGVLEDSKSFISEFDFDKILYSGIGGFNGSISAHIIRSQALTQAQITAEHNLLRSYIPEIENVVIGTQTWATSNCEMVATPQGNVIQEMKANTAVEKIINGDNVLGIQGGGYTVGIGSPIYSYGLNTLDPINGSQDARLIVTSPGTNVSYPAFGDFNISLEMGWSKISFKYKVNSGVFRITGIIHSASGIYFSVDETLTGSGTFSRYVYSSMSGTSYFAVKTDGTNLYDAQIDDYSLIQLGWADSQELYDGIYAQTTGTVEQKTYAAVKAAAMWCYYNNDVAKGAVYGKLYNWFAVKLLQMDIDYYNAANPTAPWGWRVPTASDFTTLSTFLGGDSVAGGKLKKEGLTYWNTPNTGATNETGFSAIRGGVRVESGAFANFEINGYATNIDSATVISLSANSITIGYIGKDKRRGLPLRLIKTT